MRSIAKQAIALIAQWAGIDDLAQRIVVSKTVGPADFAERYYSWSGGAIGPAHTLAQSAFFRGKNKSAKVEKPLLRGSHYGARRWRAAVSDFGREHHQATTC